MLTVSSTLYWYCLAARSRLPISPQGETSSRSDDYEPDDIVMRLNNRYWKYLRIARRNLERCKELHTMGSTYYEMISGLYYLYDDFNDRHIHFHRALQMAGMELVTILLDDANHDHLAETGEDAVRIAGNRLVQDGLY